MSRTMLQSQERNGKSTLLPHGGRPFHAEECRRRFARWAELRAIIWSSRSIVTYAWKLADVCEADCAGTSLLAEVCAGPNPRQAFIDRVHICIGDNNGAFDTRV